MRRHMHLPSCVVQIPCQVQEKKAQGKQRLGREYGRQEVYNTQHCHFAIKPGTILVESTAHSET